MQVHNRTNLHLWWKTRGFDPNLRMLRILRSPDMVFDRPVTAPQKNPVQGLER
jgi:hypothetical protein